TEAAGEDGDGRTRYDFAREAGVHGVPCETGVQWWGYPHAVPAHWAKEHRGGRASLAARKQSGVRSKSGLVVRINLNAWRVKDTTAVARFARRGLVRKEGRPVGGGIVNGRIEQAPFLRRETVRGRNG